MRCYSDLTSGECMRKNFLLVLMILASKVSAECPGIPTFPLLLEVHSCHSSEPYTSTQISEKPYSEKDLAHLQISNQFVTIIDAKPIAEIEIINWRRGKQGAIFKGDIIPIENSSNTQYMLLGTTIESCNKYYANKTALYDIAENFFCCYDMGEPKVETNAQCLLQLPVAYPSDLDLEDLPQIDFPKFEDSGSRAVR
jgi:hypothetical protein